MACKTLRHDADGVRAQLEESLALLRCDYFDLYQLHAVTDLAELDARAGAVEAILAARDEGLCRWVGITGHELSAPAAHLEALRRYDLDTVMFPVNPRLWSDPTYRQDAEALLAHAAEHDVGVMAIKAAAARPGPTGPGPRAPGTSPTPRRTRSPGASGSPCRPPGSTPSAPPATPASCRLALAAAVGRHRPMTDRRATRPPWRRWPTSRASSPCPRPDRRGRTRTDARPTSRSPARWSSWWPRCRARWPRCPVDGG